MERREALKKIGAGGAIVAGSAIIPGVQFVAHASGPGGAPSNPNDLFPNRQVASSRKTVTFTPVNSRDGVAISTYSWSWIGGQNGNSASPSLPSSAPSITVSNNPHLTTFQIQLVLVWSDGVQGTYTISYSYQSTFYTVGA